MMAKLIPAILLALSAAGCGLISFFQFKEKGFLFNNAYLFASRQERQKMDKRPYYRQSGIVFACLAIILSCLAAETAAKTGWLLIVVWTLAALVVAFAIVSSIQNERNPKYRDLRSGHMDNVNKTLYIPLYGKAQVSKAGIILRDGKAEEIWEKAQFPLRGRARSKWLSYYMAMRARVFDEWTERCLAERPEALVLHIGCGLDSRVLRAGAGAKRWYDIDFPEVIEERRRYYRESESYHMLGADASQPDWIETLPDANALIVILEGISMYLPTDAQKALFLALQKKCGAVRILMDVYTTFGAKASKVKNPIHSVGVTEVYALDSPALLAVNAGIRYVGEHSMTPQKLVDELHGFDRAVFSRMFAGRASKKLYRLYEYEITGQ